MSRFNTAAILCLIAINLSGKPNQGAKASQHKSQDQPTAATTFVNNETSSPNTSRAENSPPQWYASPEWWLVIVAFPTLFFLGWQAWETRRDAEATTKSLVDVERQVDVMVEIERPWVLASIEPTMQKQSIANQDVLFITCTLENFGNTPAVLTAWTVKIKDMQTDVLDSKPDYGHIDSIIPEVMPKGKDWKALLPLLPDRLSQAHQDKLFIYIFGFVSYNDGFGNPHETRFCFRYYPPFRDNKAQGWHFGGPHSYNSQT